jgi:hypothetical protein
MGLSDTYQGGIQLLSTNIIDTVVLFHVLASSELLGASVGLVELGAKYW